LRTAETEFFGAKNMTALVQERGQRTNEERGQPAEHCGREPDREKQRV